MMTDTLRSGTEDSIELDIPQEPESELVDIQSKGLRRRMTNLSPFRQSSVSTHLRIYIGRRL